MPESNVNETKEGCFLITSGFGANTKQPFINITVGAHDFHVQMSPGEAVELAHNLLAVAEAAQTDAFLVTWFRERVGVDDRTVVGLLEEFRAWRENGNG